MAILSCFSKGTLGKIMKIGASKSTNKKSHICKK